MNDKLMASFKNPSCEFRGAPFWAWNSKMEPEEIRRQIRLMRQMGLGGFFMHARVGLDTPYLGNEWFDCVHACIDEAKKLGMNAWLYDEDRWPSGAGGGLVTCNPAYRNRKVVAEELDAPAQLHTSADTLAVYTARIDGGNAANVKRVKDGCPAPANGEKIIHFYIKTATPDSWYNNQTYLDTMNPEAVAKFIEITHEKYKAEAAAEFHKTVPGIFTDEPFFGCQLMSEEGGNAVAPWTGKLPEVFRQRYGYELADHLMELFYDVEKVEFSQVRLNYVDCITHLFVNSFSRQIGEWCEKNNLDFTGHLLEEDSLSGQTACVGSCMRSYEYMQTPGMDELMECSCIYETAKQVASAARQFDRKWRLTETYGCTGWDFSFAGHKALGDWQTALGINIRCQHLYWYSMEGESKRDYPAAISYQSPWWREYNYVEDYFARVNAVMTEGKELRDLLVIHPVESMWTKIRKKWRAAADVKAYDDALIDLRNCLLNANIDFDYGDEDIMSRHCRIVKQDGQPLLVIGHAQYKVVVVPELITMRRTTLNLLKEFKSAGGRVVMIGKPADYLDGIKADDAVKFHQECIKIATPGKELVSKVETARKVSITDPQGKEIPALLHLLKSGDGFDALFICNTGYPEDKDPHTTMVRDRTAAHPQATLRWNTTRQGEVLELDPTSGAVYRIPAEKTADGWLINTGIQQLGSRLFVANAKPSATAYPLRDTGKTVSSRNLTQTSWDIVMAEENVLMLDRPQYRIADGEWHDNEYILAIDKVLRQHLGQPPHGGHMVQPWVRRGQQSDAIVQAELRYGFECDAIPGGALYLGLERPEFFEVSVNGNPVSTEMECGWWCDRSLRKLPVNPQFLRLGHNEILLKVRYDETHPGLEFIYLLGNFGVKIDGAANRLTPPVRSLQLGDWVSQGLPYYSGNLSYLATIDLPAGQLERVSLRLPDFRGVAAAVHINGQRAAILGFPPYETEITEFLQPGENQLAIEILNSRRNSHGPFHHPEKWPSWTGPNEFQVDKAPLQLVPCGLM